MKNIKNNIGKIFIGICLLGVFLLGHQCGKDSVKIPTYKNDNIVKIDTIWSDTLKVEVPKLQTKHDTVFLEIPYEIPLDSIKLKAFFKVRRYDNSYRSKDILINVHDSVVGYLIGQRVDYRDFKPLSITNSTITSVIPQDTVKINKIHELRASIDATSRNMYLGLEYQKDRITYGLSADPFNKIENTKIPQLKVKLAYTIFRK